MKEHKRVALFSRLMALIITIGIACVLIVIYAIAQSKPASQELVQRGAYLARAGDCIACHTAPKGKPYAGGAPIGTPMGVIYSTNITPDLETGIGHYSMDNFVKVMREGVTDDGDHLYPAMPYASYAKVSR